MSQQLCIILPAGEWFISIKGYQVTPINFKSNCRLSAQNSKQNNSRSPLLGLGTQLQLSHLETMPTSWSIQSLLIAARRCSLSGQKDSGHLHARSNSFPKLTLYWWVMIIMITSMLQHCKNYLKDFHKLVSSLAWSLQMCFRVAAGWLRWIGPSKKPLKSMARNWK